MAITDGAFRVVYENEELVVVNKPCDVPMDGEGYAMTVERWALAHRSSCTECRKGNQRFDDDIAKEPTCVHSSVMEKQAGRRKTVKFVHQLDYATSGVLCVAFSKEMAARLAHSFEMRTARKAYVAVLHGFVAELDNGARSNLLSQSFSAPQGCVRLLSVKDAPNCHFLMRCIRAATNEERTDAFVRGETIVEVNVPVGHDNTDPERFRMAICGDDAKEALTYMYVLQTGYLLHPSTSSRVAATKVILFPKTGRRHQLRLHCCALGFPIVGDATYSVPTSRSTAPRDANITAEANKRCDSGSENSDAWPRMMLHAWRLSFPVCVEPIRDAKERCAQKRQRRRETLGLNNPFSSEDSTWTHFETEDPFPPLLLDQA